METIKKIVKILPWALLIIAVTAIVAMVRYIDLEEENYNNYKIEMTETIAELQAEAVNLQGTADYLQMRVDKYSNEYDEAQAVLDDFAQQLKPIYIADPEALDTLATDLFMKGSEKIAKNDYSTFPEYSMREWDAGVTEPLETTVDGIKYEMRSIPFYWLENEYSDTFTGELLDKVYNKRFTETEGYLYVKEVEKGAKEWCVVNAELTRISETDDEIKYSVKYDRQEQGKITDKGLTCTMTIKYEEGRYRISETDFGNL